MLDSGGKQIKTKQTYAGVVLISIKNPQNLQNSIRKIPKATCKRSGPIRKFQNASLTLKTRIRNFPNMPRNLPTPIRNFTNAARKVFQI